MLSHELIKSDNGQNGMKLKTRSFERLANYRKINSRLISFFFFLLFFLISFTKYTSFLVFIKKKKKIKIYYRVHWNVTLVRSNALKMKKFIEGKGVRVYFYKHVGQIVERCKINANSYFQDIYRSVQVSPATYVISLSCFYH